jgi:hypothetical protein
MQTVATTTVRVRVVVSRTRPKRVLPEVDLRTPSGRMLSY